MSRLTEIVRWLEIRLNRPILREVPDRAFWSLFQSDDAALDQLPPSLRAAGADIDLLVAITTYNRPEACERMLTALPQLVRNAGRGLRWHVVVVKDAGGAEYGPAVRDARARLGNRVTWLEAGARLGKQGFWKTYQTLLLAARELRPLHALFLQDDLEFTPTLLRDCYARFGALAVDASPRVLYLLAADDDEAEGRWIRFRRRGAIPGVRLTQWFDLSAFFTNRAVLELLHYRVFPVPAGRWKKRPYSSGVGEQFTRRLFGRANIYQATPSLVFHGAYTTEMNPEARAVRHLDNRGPKESPG